MYVHSATNPYVQKRGRKVSPLERLTRPSPASAGGTSGPRPRFGGEKTKELLNKSSIIDRQKGLCPRARSDAETPPCPGVPRGVSPPPRATSGPPLLGAQPRWCHRPREGCEHSVREHRFIDGFPPPTSSHRWLHENGPQYGGATGTSGQLGDALPPQPPGETLGEGVPSPAPPQGHGPREDVVLSLSSRCAPAWGQGTGHRWDPGASRHQVERVRLGKEGHYPQKKNQGGRDRQKGTR